VAQEVPEPSCVHSSGRQCVSRRMPQHVDMHWERQPSSLRERDRRDGTAGGPIRRRRRGRRAGRQHCWSAGRTSDGGLTRQSTPPRPTLPLIGQKSRRGVRPVPATYRVALSCHRERPSSRMAAVRPEKPVGAVLHRGHECYSVSTHLARQL
jgi:hypothetical protein